MSNSCTPLVDTYNPVIAMQLLGPADFGPCQPNGCCQRLILLVQQIFISILRVMNYICGDHQWYNNNTAHSIVQLYIQQLQSGEAPDPALTERVHQLATALSFRANGNVSFTNSLNTQLLQSSLSEIPLVGGQLNERLSGEQTQLVQIGSLASLALEKMFINLTNITKHHEKAKTLCEIAKAIAIQDPEQASQMLEEAINTVNRMERNTLRSLELYEITLYSMAEMLASKCPQHALTAADHIVSTHWKIKAYTLVAKAQLSSNPELADTIVERAEALISRVDSPKQRAKHYCSFAAMQASRHPEHAEELFLKAYAAIPGCQKKVTKVKMICMVAKAQEGVNPQRAQEYYAEASEIAERCTDEDRAAAFSYLANAQKNNNPEQARIHLRQAIESANQMEDPDAASGRLCLIGEAIEAEQPEQARNLYLQAIEKAKIVVIDPDSPDNQNQALCDTAATQALQNPDEALQILPLITSRVMHNEVYSEAAKAYAITNPEQALITANQISQPPLKDSTLLAIAKRQASAIPQQALRTIERITCRSFKVEGSLAIAQAHASTDRTLAIQQLQQALALTEMNTLAEFKSFSEVIQALSTT